LESTLEKKVTPAQEAVEKRGVTNVRELGKYAGGGWPTWMQIAWKRRPFKLR